MDDDEVVRAAGAVRVAGRTVVVCVTKRETWERETCVARGEAKDEASVELWTVLGRMLGRGSMMPYNHDGFQATS